MRNAERTRGKVLAAAVAEFSQNGYAGARVDRIASRASANKRLIYHHFSGKQAVFEAVLAHRVTTQGEATGDLVRLWMHEALERGDEDIVRFDDRRELAAARVDAARDAQERGDLPTGVDPAYLALARLALEVFPLAFPQLVRVATGHRAASEEFRSAWNRFLRDWYDPRARRPAKPRIRLDRDRVLRAATRPTGAALCASPARASLA